MYSIEKARVYSRKQEQYVTRWYVADIRGVRISVYMSAAQAQETLAALKEKHVG